MNEITFGSRTYTVDALGFLTDPAEGMASWAGMSGGLTERHWEVIRYIREEFRDRGDCPTGIGRSWKTSGRPSCPLKTFPQGSC